MKTLRKTSKTIAAFLLTFAMLAGLFPVGAFASEDAGARENVPISEELQEAAEEMLVQQQEPVGEALEQEADTLAEDADEAADPVETEQEDAEVPAEEEGPETELLGVDPVASVTEKSGTPTNYINFFEAVEAWNGSGNGATLKLLADIKVNDLNSLDSEFMSVFRVVGGSETEPKTLDLNDHGILLDRSLDLPLKLITVTNHSHFRLMDSAATKTDRYIVLNENRAVAVLGTQPNEGTTDYCKIQGGYLSGGFDLNGGGAAVFVYEGGTFVMDGGTICGNYSCYNGGGVHCIESSFIMNGGAISYNRCDNCGGGVFGYGGSFTMNGGEISHNTSDFGAGVFFVGYMNMNDGKISNNEAFSGGGGVTCGGEPETELFTMNGGMITENKACVGGGVLVGSDMAPGLFVMSGGVISNNTASDAGSAILVYQGMITFEGQLKAGEQPDGTDAVVKNSEEVPGEILDNRVNYGYLEIVGEGEFTKVIFDGWKSDGDYSVYFSGSSNPITRGMYRLPSGEDLSLRFVPSSIKTIKSVTYTIEGETQPHVLNLDANGAATIPASAMTDKDVTVALTFDTVSFNVAFDDGFGTVYTVENIINKTLTVAGGDNFSFKPVAPQNRRIKQVMVERGDQGAEELSDDGSGFYTVNRVASDCLITVVTASDKQYTVTFDNGFNTSYNVLLDDGLGGGYYCDNSVVSVYELDNFSFYILPIDNRFVSSVKVKTGGTESVLAPMEFGGTVYVLENVQGNCEINVTMAQGVSVTAESNYIEEVTLYAYDNVNDISGVPIIYGVPFTIAYNSDFYIYAESAYEDYVIEGIVIGETELDAVADKEGVYKIPAALTKNDITLFVKANYYSYGEYTNFAVNYADHADEMCSFSVTDPANAVQVDSNWTLPYRTRNFTYTIEAQKGFTPSATILQYDGNEDKYVPFKEISLGTPVLSNNGKTFIYTVTDDVIPYRDAILLIGASKQSYRLEFLREHVKTLTVVYADGTPIEPASTEDNVTTFEGIDPTKKLKITAVPEDGYEITGAFDSWENDANALIRVDGAFLYTVQVDSENVNYIRFASEAVTFVTVDGKPVGNNAIVGADDPFKKDVKIIVSSAAAQFDKTHITKVTTSVSGYSPAIADNGTITIEYNEKTSAAKQPVKVTIEGKDNADKAFKFVVSLVFKKEITQFSVTGAKKNKDNVFVIEQTAGTTKDYPVKVSANAWPGDVVAEVAAVGGGDCNATAKIDPAKGVLIITTAKDKSIDGNKTERSITTQPFTVSFKSTTNTELGSVTVNPIMKGFAAPTATLALASDRHLEYALSLPKANAGMMNLFYQIEATAVTAKGQNVAAAMKEAVPAYTVSVDDPQAGNIFLAKESIEKGHGAAQKYNVTISVVQKEKVTLDAQSAVCDYDEENLVDGKEKTLKNQSTKDPAYESSLKLAKKQAAFTQGEKNVLVAVAKYSKQTTWTGLSSAIIVDAKGERHSTNVFREANGMTEIFFSDTSSIAVGAATLYAYPVFVNNQYANPATLSLTVKAPIDKIDVTPNVSRLYKQDKKTASLKLTATPWWDGDIEEDEEEIGEENGVEDEDEVEYQKPASKKVKWSIVDEEGEDLLDGDPRCAITVKNGSVTIPKDFVTSAYMTFCVKVEADDFAGNPTYTLTDPITVTTTRIHLNGATIKDSDDREMENKDEITGSQAKGTQFQLIDDNGKPVKTCDLTLKVPGGLTVEEKDETTFRITTITKFGHYKITATANDGGKSSYSIEFTVKTTEPRYFVMFGMGNYREDQTSPIDTIYPQRDENGEPTGEYLTKNATAFVLLAQRDDAPLGTIPKPTVKGGKIIYTVGEPGGSLFCIKPAKYDGESKIEIKFAGKTYTIINTNESAGLSVTKNTSTDFWADAKDGQTFNFYFTSEVEGAEKIRFIPNVEMGKRFSLINANSSTEMTQYIRFLKALNTATISPVAGKVGEYEMSVKLPGFPAGTYSFDAMLMDADGNTLTKPCTVPFKAVPVKKPGAKINEKCTLAENVAGSKVTVTLKTADFATIELTKCLNNNDSGKVNNFTEHFKLSDEGYDPAAKSFKLEMTTPLSMEEWTACKGKMTGWIQYTITNGNYDPASPDPNTIEKDAVAKVVVTIPKPEN